MDRHLRVLQHASGQTVVIVEFGRQAGVEHGKVKTEVEHTCLFPCEVFVEHFLVNESGSDGAVEHVVVLCHYLALLICTHAAVVTQKAVRRAEFGVVEPCLHMRLEPWFLAEAPSERTGGEKAVLMAGEEFGASVDAEIEFGQITVEGVVACAAYERAQAFARRCAGGCLCCG